MNAKSVDLEDLFSQIGGSVGILLGYSILQIPTLISMINHLILGIYGHLMGEKKDVALNNKVEQIWFSNFSWTKNSKVICNIFARHFSQS